VAKVQIKHRFTDAVLFECDVPDEIDSGLRVRHALEKATAARAYLRDADLRGAGLRGADLSDADLSGADLRGAGLRGAGLSGADLRGADLRGADLSDADLRGAGLRGADLRGADLSDADLSGADLRGADLRDADLSDADLSDADLRDADLSGADLSGADLSPIKTDFFDVLLRAPREVSALRAALMAGGVDGSTYEGVCACLVGTIANARHANSRELGAGLKPDSSRPAERFFLAIRKGDTPETNGAAKIAVEWIDEFAGLMAAAREAA
jgi:uncharacterized protein YjbI with pentapeptide repeats